MLGGCRPLALLAAGRFYLLLKTEPYILCKFSDGSAWECPTCTVVEFKAQNPNRAKSEVVALWESTHDKTNNVLQIKQRTDRALLLALYEGKKQIGNVRLDKIGDLPLPQPAVVGSTDKTLLLGVSILQPIAEKYKAAEIDKKDIYKLRDKAVREIRQTGAHNFEKGLPSQRLKRDRRVQEAIWKKASVKVEKDEAAATVKTVKRKPVAKITAPKKEDSETGAEQEKVLHIDFDAKLAMWESNCHLVAIEKVQAMMMHPPPAADEFGIVKKKRCSKA